MVNYVERILVGRQKGSWKGRKKAAIEREKVEWTLWPQKDTKGRKKGTTGRKKDAKRCKKDTKRTQKGHKRTQIGQKGRKKDTNSL